MDNLRSKVNRWLPVLLWMGLIFFLSSQSYLFPYPHYIIDFLLSKAAHLLKYGVLAILLLNQAAHFFEYAVLAVLLHRAVGNEGGWRAFLMGGLYALSDEFHQGFVPGRNAELLDLAFDILGVVSGLYMAKTVISPKELSC